MGVVQIGLQLKAVKGSRLVLGERHSSYAALREVEKRARGGRRLWRKPGRELGGESSSGRRARKGGYLWRGSIRELGVAGSSGRSRKEGFGGSVGLGETDERSQGGR